MQSVLLWPHCGRSGTIVWRNTPRAIPRLHLVQCFDHSNAPAAERGGGICRRKEVRELSSRLIDSLIVYQIKKQIKNSGVIHFLFG